MFCVIGHGRLWWSGIGWTDQEGNIAWYTGLEAENIANALTEDGKENPSSRSGRPARARIRGQHFFYHDCHPTRSREKQKFQEEALRQAGKIKKDEMIDDLLERHNRFLPKPMVDLETGDGIRLRHDEIPDDDPEDEPHPFLL